MSTAPSPSRAGIPAVISTVRKGIAYLFHHGPQAFVVRVRQGLSELAVRNQPPAQPGNVFEEAYVSLLAMSSKEAEGPDYVPLAADPQAPTEGALRLIAFYLPQFHPIPENDKWWGRGFTEWTNVSKAVPQFIGHYQPHLPGELGFYDLRIPEVQKRQVELARQYGIHGFAFYYYWFNGKRLLHAPVDQFLADKEADFPFCIFWANENWTRRWDGKEDDVLIAQNNSPEGDVAFIRDVEPFLRDPRYIRIAGRPVLMVYRVQLLPDPKATAQAWRDYCRKAGIGEIYLIAGQVYGFEDPRPAGFDAALEFPPHNSNTPRINDSVTLLNRSFDGHIYQYQDLARHYLEKPTELPYELFKTVSPAWDNAPRKPGAGSTWAFSTPALYRTWLRGACEWTLGKDAQKRVVFINAWNEWGEGAYLEPDRRFGYAYLQATADTLRECSGLRAVPVPGASGNRTSAETAAAPSVDTASEQESQPIFSAFVEELRRIDSVISTTPPAEIPALFRRVPLEVFANLTLLPREEFPHINAFLPTMPPAEAQEKWTGAQGDVLLGQTVAYIRMLLAGYAALGEKPIDRSAVLDFGCGWGRIIRLLYKYVPVGNLYGVDPWSESIKLCKRYGVKAHLAISDYVPASLPFDRQFDLIFAFSVFTHLSEKTTQIALATLRKYVNPGGVLCITIRPKEYWKYHRDPAVAPDMERRHDEDGFAFQPHDRPAINGDITYGDASMSLDYIRARFPEWLLETVEHSAEDPLQVVLHLKPA